VKTPQKIKVTNVYKTFLPDSQGGLQQAIRQTCIATSQHGIENHVYTLSNQHLPKCITLDGIHVIRDKSIINIASCDVGGISSLKTFRNLVATSDIIHLYHPWPFADFLSLTSKHKPTVVTYVSDIIRQQLIGYLHRPLLNKTLRDARVIVANCPAYIKSSPVLSHPKLENKLHVIPLGIDERTYPVVEDTRILEKIGVNYRQPYFLFLGVLRYYKGLHTLIQAAKYVKNPIYIAGSGPMEASLKQMARELGVNNLIFLGRVSDHEKVMLIKHCLAMILPSHLRSEAYGMVLVEAAMYGKPMITCEIGTGTSFINQHEVTGFVIAPENISQLVEAMNGLTAPDVNRQFGLNARKRYDAFFSGPALGKAYAELYKSIL